MRVVSDSGLPLPESRGNRSRRIIIVPVVVVEFQFEFTCTPRASNQFSHHKLIER